MSAETVISIQRIGRSAATPSAVQPKSVADIEAELKEFERKERARLGLIDTAIEHWTDSNPQRFTRRQRDSTTILLGGLTRAQDLLVRGAWRGLGYQVEVLDVPDVEALRHGREFGNRGQCNPTYFTVGNLIKHLCGLRDRDGLTAAQIVERYVFITAGACGPCRFGTYATEYRKALRDAGFEGFRVLLFQQQGGLKQATGEGDGLEMNPRFFVGLLKALVAGDVLNAIGYRLRPYEVETGSADRALRACETLLHDALNGRRSVLVALLRCRRTLARVAVDRRQPKPKVAIIGEFWAMTTEGDGNHRLQRFLEQEGAEVETQPVTAWLLYMLWAARWDTVRRRALGRRDSASQGIDGVDVGRRLRLLRAGELVLRATFALYARIVGLRHCALPDMDALATLGHEHYDNHLRGGEGHMEVAKLIHSVQHRSHHMVVSVKPFGCMPSSGVSDGIQSLVIERYPDAIFCPIETTGDGAANLQSRVLMDLFKARQRALEEHALAGATRTGHGPSARRRARRAMTDPLWYPGGHGIAGTAARALAESR